MRFTDADGNCIDGKIVEIAGPFSGRGKMLLLENGSYIRPDDFVYDLRISEMGGKAMWDFVKAGYPYRDAMLLRRYRHLVAHLICESLGYFTPRRALRALIAYKMDESYCCEWYSSMVPKGTSMFDDGALRKIGKDVVVWAIASRKMHTGYMASLQMALAVIDRELDGKSAELASWF